MVTLGLVRHTIEIAEITDIPQGRSAMAGFDAADLAWASRAGVLSPA